MSGEIWQEMEQMAKRSLAIATLALVSIALLLMPRDAEALEPQRVVSPGGIEAWLRLGEACGLPRAELLDNRHLLPGVKFAVDAYLNFARRATWQEAACSSLTELFAPTIHEQRIAGMLKHPSWRLKRARTCTAKSRAT